MNSLDPSRISDLMGFIIQSVLLAGFPDGSLLILKLIELYGRFPVHLAFLLIHYLGNRSCGVFCIDR